MQATTSNLLLCIAIIAFAFVALTERSVLAAGLAAFALAELFA